MSLSMGSDSRNLMWTPVLLLLSGVLCKEWRVEYQPDVCAVKGSSVVIPCSFHYPADRKVERVLWVHGRNRELKQFYEGPFIFNSDLVDNSSKFQYFGDRLNNCSLKIDQVEHTDAGYYGFRFETDSPKGKFSGYPRLSKLKIVDLKAVVAKPNRDRTKEGDPVNLTCVNDCENGSLSSAFTWIKNGEPVNKGPVLYFSNISSPDSGNYSCSLTAHKGTTSEVININVEYSPKNTSLSALPSTEFDTDSNITLTCSSDANPRVENYTWFKIGDGNTGVVSYGFKLVLHFRDVSPSGDLQYFCSATNKHGSQNSTVTLLRVDRALQAHLNNTGTRDVVITTATIAALLILMATVIVVRRLNKKRTQAPDAASVEEDQNAVYLNWPQVGNQCEETTTDLLYVTVDFNTKRNPNMQQHMDAHSGDDDDDEGVVYTSVCRDQNLKL